MTVIGVSFDVDFAIDKTSRSRKAALWALGKRIANLRSGSTGDEIAMYLILRERLGSLAIGQGIAMPQAVFPMPEIPLIQISRLSQAVDFDAIDGEQVNLLLSVVGDRRDHRKMRDAIDRCMLISRNARLLNQIRTAQSNADVISAFENAKKPNLTFQVPELIGAQN